MIQDNNKIQDNSQSLQMAVSHSCGSLKIIHFLFGSYVYYTLLCRIILKHRNYDKYRINEFIS